MNKKLERVLNLILLVCSSVLFLLLILSDFGLIITIDNIFSRVLLHISLILLIATAVSGLKSK